jgi:carboxyl-terminal processing protease
MKLLYKPKAFYLFFFAALLVNVTAGCKKDDPAEVPVVGSEIKTPLDVAPSTGTRDQLTKDSIFLYARQVYLWWDLVPDYDTFKPRDYPNFDSELYAITRFGINPLTNKPYEFDEVNNNEPKYSYISDITQKNPVAYVPEKKSSVDLDGNGNDFGLLLGVYGTKSSYTLSIKAIYPGSPAARAGFKRGDRITKINNKTFGSNYDAEINEINTALFNSSSIRIAGFTSENVSFDRSLNTASYKSSPIYKDSVYTSGSKKIGYLAYARFSDGTNSYAEFDRIFSRFIQYGVTDLILDLRYNGGGYVTTAENLVNRIAPSSLNGKIMFTEYYNKLMQEGKATILSKQALLKSDGTSQYQNGKLVTYADVDYSVKANTNYFQKVGALNNIASVVFIVSSSTASASELVINSLKPHMPVKIVGSTTYGKPVGFFPVRIDKYDVYFSMFETQNSKGEGKYYAGFTPDTGTSTADNDNVNYDFGDIRESSFAAAYNFITKGTYTSEVKSSGTIMSQKPEVSSSQSLHLDTEFKGMIKDPAKLKRK